MLRHARLALVLSALLAVATASAIVVHAQTSATLTVRLYNTAGVSTETLLSARRSAEQILRDTGLDVVIRHCGRSRSPQDPVSACDTPLTSTEVVVRLIESPSVETSLPDETYGVTYVVRETGRGWLATVFPDRIESAGLRAGVDPGTLIGRVMAHEVGHLLLGASYHGPAGVMMAEWPDSILHRRSSDWRFSMAEADRMQRALSVSADPAHIPSL
jgi:hypothetical protein